MQIPQELSATVRKVAHDMCKQSGTASLVEITGAMLPVLTSIVASILTSDPQFEKAGAHSALGQMYALVEQEEPQNGTEA